MFTNGICIESKKTPVVVHSRQGVQKITVHQSSISNNDSTLIGTQERQRNPSDNYQNGQGYKDKKQELEGLLKELNEDESDDELNKIPKTSAIKVIQGSFEPNDVSDGIFEDKEDQFSPEKQFGDLQQVDIGEYEIKDEDEDGNFLDSNHYNDNVIKFENKEILNYEPKTSIFNENESQDIFNSDKSNQNKSRNLVVNEQIESPKQLNLNELLDDDFDVDDSKVNKIDNKQIKTKAKEEEDPLNDDFLNEFEW